MYQWQVINFSYTLRQISQYLSRSAVRRSKERKALWENTQKSPSKANILQLRRTHYWALIESAKKRNFERSKTANSVNRTRILTKVTRFTFCGALTTVPGNCILILFLFYCCCCCCCCYTIVVYCCCIIHQHSSLPLFPMNCVRVYVRYRAAFVSYAVEYSPKTGLEMNFLSYARLPSRAEVFCLTVQHYETSLNDRNTIVCLVFCLQIWNFGYIFFCFNSFTHFSATLQPLPYIANKTKPLKSSHPKGVYFSFEERPIVSYTPPWADINPSSSFRLRFRSKLLISKQTKTCRAGKCLPNRSVNT